MESVVEKEISNGKEAECIGADVSRKKNGALFAYPALPKWETRFYWSVVVVLIAYAWYCIFDASSRFHFPAHYPTSVSELPFFGKRVKDEGNWEWAHYRSFAYNYIVTLALHSVLLNFGEKLIKTDWIMEILMTVYSLAVCCFLFSPLLLICSVLQGTCIFIFRHFCRKTWSVWLSGLPILWFTMNRAKLLHHDSFLVLFFANYMLLSYISFNLEQLRGNSRKEDDTLLKQYCRMFYYSLYQPYMLSLIVTYDDFERQIRERKQRTTDYIETATFALRIAFWWLTIELALHFMYFEAILHSLPYAYSLPEDRFVSLGMTAGSFFHMKYVVIFGVPAIFARLDGMQPLQGPICISRVALYSKIWRGFDRGLYAFFKRYIFLPICQPTFSVYRKVFGILLSYSFVLLWHGLYHNNIVWIALNVFELFIEYAAKGFYCIHSVRKWREDHISDTHFRRILAWLQIAPLAFGIYSNFYFLCGSAAGYAFVDRIFWGETVTLQLPFFLLISFGYCYVNVGIDSELYCMEKQNKVKSD